MNLRYYKVKARFARLKMYLLLNLDDQLKTSEPLFAAMPSKKTPESIHVSVFFKQTKAAISNYVAQLSIAAIVPPIVVAFYAQKKAIIQAYVSDFLWEHPIKMPSFLSAFYGNFREEVDAFVDDHAWLQRLLATRKSEVKWAFLGLVYLTVSTVAFSLKSVQVAQNQRLTTQSLKEKYGFKLSEFAVTESTIQQGDAVFSLLKNNGLTIRQTDSLLQKVKKSYDFQKIKTGKPYALFCKNNPANDQYLVVEPDAKRYFVFDFKTPSVKEVKRPITVREFQIGGKIQKTLYSSLLASGMSFSLIDMVQAALKDKFNSSKFEEGDEYKLIWEEELVDGHSIGVNKLKSVYINGQCIDKPVYAFYFSNGKERGWYEKDSLPVRDGFIDSPVKNSKITSSFSLHRFHPILHYTRPHYGTDYAAPSGTPIMSVADGVVEEAKYDGGNGNYVKIQHKNTYETQYLHMSRFAKGIEKGTVVKQKQIIGYVGSTGLATGPHVCFRFKKLGTPINHLTERIYSAIDSLNFKKLATTMKARINKIAVLTDVERDKQKEVFVQLRKK